MRDYSKAKIYKLQCDDGYFYYGSTIKELRFRLAEHKGASKKRSHLKVYNHINKQGWDECVIVLVELYPCMNRTELREKEDEYIQQHIKNPLCLNVNYAKYNLEKRKDYERTYSCRKRRERGVLPRMKSIPAIKTKSIPAIKTKSIPVIKTKKIVSQTRKRRMVADSTIKQYNSRIAILKKAGVDPVAEPASLVEWFKKTEQGESSQKLYLSAIKFANPDKFPKELQDMIDELYSKQNKRDKNQMLSAKQEEKFVPFAEILTAQKTLAKKENKTEQEMKDYLMISLYTLMPPLRADYGDMLIVPKYDKNGTGNELVYGDKGMEIVLREYKTQKTYKTLRLKLNKKIQAVIEEYFMSLEKIPDYLFGDKPITASYFSALFEKTMKRVVGKAFGISLMRHSYITAIYPTLKTIKQKEALAKRMAHSTSLQEQYNIPSLAEME